MARIAGGALAGIVEPGGGASPGGGSPEAGALDVALDVLAALWLEPPHPLSAIALAIAPASDRLVLIAPMLTPTSARGQARQLRA
jgi:hypothetical protein